MMQPGAGMPGRIRGVAFSFLAVAFLLFSVSLAGGEVQAEAENVNSIVNADIQAGIEKHIQEQVDRHGGYFPLRYGGLDLRLKLVRVHVEYLASLGPTRHFACVDMVDEAGEFYDVDFFMEGPRGDMKVTETTVHKVNGKPLYLWKQAPDKTWGRVPVDGAGNDLLGIVNGRDTFLFIYEAVIPDLKEDGRLWIPLASPDEFQKVRVAYLKAPVGHKILTDVSHDNKVLFFELKPEHAGRKIAILYEVERMEKSAYPGDPSEAASYLERDADTSLQKRLNTVAEKITAGKESPLSKARTIYDHIIDTMTYKRCGKGWGSGDVGRMCDLRYGNCSDFHSYFVALARAAGIPARFAVGAAIPSERNEGGVDGYHCWAEFFAEGKWWPVDISEANKFTSLSMYYFGHHPANRFELSRGRNIVLAPGPRSGPINFLAYPVLEVGDKEQILKPLFGFERKKSLKITDTESVLSV